VYKVEQDPVNSEEKNEESSEEGRGKISEWFAENLRMVVSIVIVVVIAAGIYSYSKRTQAPVASKSASVTEENAEGKISVIGGEEEGKTAEEGQQAAPQTEEQKAKPSEGVSSVQSPTSQETENSFVETAAKGDGSTKLARRALANYLEKNPDSGLSAEHKIYVEDYLRRQVADGHLNIGDKREFSKDMIANAIQKSKELNEKQIKNLQKYAQRVPELN
jgi:hypothetical protein